ncbi:MAG: DUF255 domain-containing protein [Kiritimatiellales bacterium]
MKKFGFTGIVLLAALAMAGCDEKTATEAAVWQTDYDAAVKQATEENKYILVNISGLQWCRWCRLLEEEVFSTPDFITYAKDNLICVLLDFGRDGQPTAAEFAARHNALLERYQIQGFPTVLIQKPDGKTIVRTGYQRGGPENYVKFIQGVIEKDNGTN